MAKKHFTCPDCGGQSLKVVREYLLTKLYHKRLSCVCEEDSWPAAIGVCSVTVWCRDRGLLEQSWFDYTAEWEVEGEKDASANEEPDEWVFDIGCARCFENACAGDWETSCDTPDEPDFVDWQVFCGGCGREVEFAVSSGRFGQFIIDLEELKLMEEEFRRLIPQIVDTYMSLERKPLFVDFVDTFLGKAETPEELRELVLNSPSNPTKHNRKEVTDYEDPRTTRYSEDI